MLFGELNRILDPGERIAFTISCEADGQLAVLVQPLLKPVAGEEPVGDVAQVRAALAMPLKVQASTDELDAGLVALLREYGEKRLALRRTIPVLEALSERGKAARARAATGTPTVTTEPDPASSQTPPASAGNPDSLI